MAVVSWDLARALAYLRWCDRFGSLDRVPMRIHVKDAGSTRALFRRVDRAGWDLWEPVRIRANADGPVPFREVDGAVIGEVRVDWPPYLIGTKGHIAVSRAWKKGDVVTIQGCHILPHELLESLEALGEGSR
jgi:hypothetical protein